MHVICNPLNLQWVAELRVNCLLCAVAFTSKGPTSLISLSTSEALQRWLEKQYPLK